MIRMFARRMTSLLLDQNTDEVIVGLTLPSDSVIHDINMEVHIVGDSNLTAAQVAFYAAF